MHLKKQAVLWYDSVAQMCAEKISGGENMGNIVLIGMPGCGKSTLGVALARAMHMKFLDSDRAIISEMGATLSELIREYGQEGFRNIENRVNASLKCENTVIATGGSVVYGKEAMEHLRQTGTVVYMKLPYEEIEQRLGDLQSRGVSMKPGQTLRDLYLERCPLYEKYAHITFDCEHKRLRQLVCGLSDLLGEK